MRRLKSPLTMQVELTSSCNHQCNHCYNFWRVEDYIPRIVSVSEITVQKNVAEKIIGGDVFHVTLSGGEPLLFPENDLEEMIKQYCIHHVSVGLNSNLTLATQRHGEMFKEYGVAVLVSVPSYIEEEFDRVTRTKGSFQSFLKKSKRLTSKEVYLSANMVVDKNRLSQVYKTGRFVADLGYRGFNATRLSPSNNGTITDYPALLLNNSEISHLLDQLIAVENDFGLSVGTLNALPYCCVSEPEKYRQFFTRGCVAGLTTAGVSPEGDVRACQHFNIQYGSLLKEPLSSIWQRMPTWKNFYSGKDCGGCAYKSRCSGGCRENAYHLTGKIGGEDNLKVGGFGRITDVGNKANKPAPETITLVNNLRVRQEEFGGVLFKNPARYAFVDDFTLFAVKKLSSREKITQRDFLEVGSSLDIDQAYVDTVFLSLINNKIAKITEE